MIPRAVLYFTGDIFGEDDEDFEDCEDEDSEEEDWDVFISFNMGVKRPWYSDTLSNKGSHLRVLLLQSGHWSNAWSR